MARETYKVIYKAIYLSLLVTIIFIGIVIVGHFVLEQPLMNVVGTASAILIVFMAGLPKYLERHHGRYLIQNILETLVSRFSFRILMEAPIKPNKKTMFVMSAPTQGPPSLILLILGAIMYSNFFGALMGISIKVLISPSLLQYYGLGTIMSLLGCVANKPLTDTMAKYEHIALICADSDVNQAPTRSGKKVIIPDSVTRNYAFVKEAVHFGMQVVPVQQV